MAIHAKTHLGPLTSAFIAITVKYKCKYKLYMLYISLAISFPNQPNSDRWSLFTTLLFFGGWLRLKLNNLAPFLIYKT